MTKDKLLHTPEGVRDIYGRECHMKRDITDRLLHQTELYGFDMIETPTLEFFDIFSAERGTAPSKNMYKLIDREGNTLVMRPDITPSVARCVAKYYRNGEEPVRLSYVGSTFQNNGGYQGKSHEQTQAGAELIGDASVYADAEMIALTIDCLLASGLTEFQVEIGEVNFFKAIIDEAGIGKEEEEEIKAYIVDKNTFGLKDYLSNLDIPAQYREILENLPFMFGPASKLESYKNMTSSLKARAAVERLEKIYDLIGLYGYQKYVSFDLGVLSPYGYYTGIIFFAFTYGLGDAIINGGRYDKLMGQFGQDRPAIGMAVVVDRLMTALTRQGIETCAAEEVTDITGNEEDYAQALRKAIEARKSGKRARVAVR